MLEIILLLNSGWILLFARLVLGAVMTYNSWPKVRDLKSNLGALLETKSKYGIALEITTALIGLIGGVAILAGVFTEIITILFIVQLATVTIWKISRERKPFSEWSYDLLLISLSLIILTFGPGPYAIAQLL